MALYLLYGMSEHHAHAGLSSMSFLSNTLSARFNNIKGANYCSLCRKPTAEVNFPRGNCKTFIITFDSFLRNKQKHRDFLDH